MGGRHVRHQLPFTRTPWVLGYTQPVSSVGGLMLGTCAAVVTSQLANVMLGATPPAKLAYAAALVGFFRLSRGSS